MEKQITSVTDDHMRENRHRQVEMNARFRYPHYIYRITS